jgi:hypothetical protein
MVTVLLLLLVVLAGVAGGWLWRERRRPLHEAFALLERDEKEAWHGGAAMLARLLPRLRPEQAAEASFGLAYARARLGELRDAAAILDDLSSAGTRDRAVLHLDLWVKVKQRRYEDAARSWQDVAEEQLRDLEESRYLAGIAIFALAREALARRDVDEALRRFTHLRELGVLTDRIPDSVTDHRIMVGVEHVRSGELGPAKVSFAKAEEAARDDRETALLARLGLLLCDWRKRAAPDADFHRRLAEVVEEVRDRADAVRPGQERLVRDLLLWQAVAVVAGWLNLVPSGGLPAEERDRLAARLHAVREADPEMPDPDLIGGVIGLFLRAPGDERAVANALEALGRASDHGVVLPAVLHLLEAATAGGATDGVREHLVIVRDYLADERVPLTLRWRLRDHLVRFERVRRLLEEDVRGADREYAVSLADLVARGQLLHERITTLVIPTLAARAPDHVEQVTGMADELDRAIRSLREQADAFTALEQRLILLAGQFLLQEDPVGQA